MASKSKGASLTLQEKRIVKALFSRGWSNQDIQAIVNSHRKATVNFGRFSGVKKDNNQKPADADEVEYFFLHKQAHDPQTGLNRYDNERLVRAREAMILAVQIFNSAALRFKAEVFCVLCNIAWTYLLHEYYERKNVPIVNKDGNSLLLGQMLERADCPLSQGVRDNLRTMKRLRDKVEHLLIGKADFNWLPMFQACCLNFEKTLCEFFGERLTLSTELSFALQFAKLNIEQAAAVNKYEIPPHIEAVDAHIAEGLSDEQIANIEFRFKVIYTLDAAAKSKSHFQFFRPESAEGKEIHNVLTQLRAADEMYPHKPSRVVELVQKRVKVSFTSNDHTKAWRYLKVRPQKRSGQPQNTNKEFCLYHQAHGDYTYSDAWIDHLVEMVDNPTKLAAIRAEKI